MQKQAFLFAVIGIVAAVILYIPAAWSVTVNPGPTFINSQTNYTSGTTFSASSIQVQPNHIYLGSKYYDLVTSGGKVAANVTSFYEGQNVTVHIINSSLTNVNMTVAGQATRVSIDGTFYDYGTRWYYINGNNSTLINVQSGRTVFVDFVTPTAITSTDPRLASSGEQRTSYFDGTNNWIFYYDGSNIVYRYSQNGGVVWSAPASTGSGTLAANSYFSVYGESNKVIVTWASAAGAFTKTGTISGTSIGWATGVSVPLPPNIGQNYYPSFEKVGSNLFLGANVLANGSNSVALNNVQSTSDTIPSKSHPITLASFNSGTGSNRLLLVGIEANNQYVTSVTFGGVSLTKAVSHFHNNDAEFWYLVNPSGTGDIVVTMNGKTSAVVGAYAFSGVNQTNPIPTTATNFNTASSSPTVSITTQYPNSWVLDSPAIYGGKTLGSPTCTQEWNINIPSAITGASSSKTTTSPSTVTCSWAASPSGDLWDDVAVEVRAAGANSGTVVNSTSLGSSWSPSTTLYSGEIQPAIVGLAKYGSTNLVAVFAKYGNSEFNYATFNGVSWSGISPTSGAGLTTNANKTQAFSITSNGTCAWVGYVPSNSGGTLKSMVFCASPTFLITPSSGTNIQPTIGMENGNIELLYVQGGIIRALTNQIHSATWQPEVKPLGYSFVNAQYPHVAKNGTSSNNSFLPLVWREQTASPFAVKFKITNPFNWQNDTQIDTDGIIDLTQVEPHVTVSRSSTSPNTLVTGYIQFSESPLLTYPERCAVSRSLDSGSSWQQGTYNGNSALPNGGQSIGGDPSVSSFLNGTLIYSCLGSTTSTNSSYPPPYSSWMYLDGSSISFVKSTDGGLTWVNATQDIKKNSESTPGAPPPQIDKPWIAVDWGAFSSYNNRVYACWTEFDYSAHTTRIKFAQVLPTPTANVTIDSAQWFDNTNRTKGPYVQGCQIATGPGVAGVGNELFLVYEKVNNSTSGQILFNRNYNGGDPSSWLSTSKVIGTFQRFSHIISPCVSANGNTIIDGCLQDQGGMWFRAGHLPYLAVDKLGDPHVVWTTFSNKYANTVYTSSYDCTASQGLCDFAHQVTINNNTSDQFEPSIVVSDSSVSPYGIIFVMDNDKREDPANQAWKPWSYYCVPTVSGGTGSCQNASEWVNLKIANDQTQTTETFVGDYQGTASSKSNQAISIYPYQSCNVCTRDIHNLGAK